MTGPDDQQVIRDLYERLFPAVLAYARRYADEHAARDCAQEVFLRLMQYRVLDRRDIGLAYLLKMARNQLRKERRRALDLRRVSDKQRKTTDAAWITESREMPTPVVRRLANLPAGHFEAVVLTSVRGLRCDQAANALAVSSTALIRKRDTGLKNLRAQVQDIECRPTGANRSWSGSAA